MTEAPTTQLVSVSFGLAGQQYARITVTHAGTRQAEMSLLWGSLLLTLTTEAQVENLKLAWFSAALVRALPANLGSLAVLSGIDPGMQRPGVVLRMHGEAAHWTVEHLPARYARLGPVGRPQAVKDVGAVHARLPDQVAATAAGPGVNAASPSLIMMLVC